MIKHDQIDTHIQSLQSLQFLQYLPSLHKHLMLLTQLLPQLFSLALIPEMLRLDLLVTMKDIVIWVLLFQPLEEKTVPDA